MELSQYSNTSAVPLHPPTKDPFLACWRLQDCQPCLRSTYSCSWCPVSGTCVPNHARIPLLAPISREDICPLAWRERLELRSKPFGCRVSTFTFLTGLISVVSTLVGVFLIWMLLMLGRWGRRRWVSREEGWWKIWKVRPRWLGRIRWTTRAKGNKVHRARASESEGAETRPLLG